jgi:hypothetical protein
MNQNNLIMPPPLPFLPPPPQQLLPVQQDLSLADIAKVLPFCPFAKVSIQEAQSSTTRYNNANNVIMPSRESTLNDDTSTDSVVVNSAPSPPANQEERLSLEYQLLHRGILQVPPMDPDFIVDTTASTTSSSTTTTTTSNLSIVDTLERDLWLAMNYFLVTTKWPVSPILLSLLPPLQQHGEEQKWPQDFILYKIANELAQLETMEHDFVVVSSDYPAYRRQRRLSFSAAFLLEEYYQTKLGNVEAGQSLKRLLLRIPSTKQRLRVVLERFLQWQHQHWGEFQ